MKLPEGLRPHFVTYALPGTALDELKRGEVYRGRDPRRALWSMGCPFCGGLLVFPPGVRFVIPPDNGPLTLLDSLRCPIEYCRQVFNIAEGEVFAEGSFAPLSREDEA